MPAVRPTHRIRFAPYRKEVAPPPPVYRMYPEEAEPEVVPDGSWKSERHGDMGRKEFIRKRLCEVERHFARPRRAREMAAALTAEDGDDVFHDLEDALVGVFMGGTAAHVLALAMLRTGKWRRFKSASVHLQAIPTLTEGLDKNPKALGKKFGRTALLRETAAMFGKLRRGSDEEDSVRFHLIFGFCSNTGHRDLVGLIGLIRSVPRSGKTLCPRERIVKRLNNFKLDDKDRTNLACLLLL